MTRVSHLSARLFRSHFVCSLATSSVSWPLRLLLAPPPLSLSLSVPWPPRLFHCHLVCSLATSSVPRPPRLFLGLLVHLVCSVASSSTSSVPWPPRLFLGLFVCSVASSSVPWPPRPPRLFLGHLVCSLAASSTSSVPWPSASPSDVCRLSLSELTGFVLYTCVTPIYLWKGRREVGRGGQLCVTHHCRHHIDSELRWAAMRAILMFR